MLTCSVRSSALLCDTIVRSARLPQYEQPKGLDAQSRLCADPTLLEVPMQAAVTDALNSGGAAVSANARWCAKAATIPLSATKLSCVRHLRRMRSQPVLWRASGHWVATRNTAAIAGGARQELPQADRPVTSIAGCVIASATSVHPCPPMSNHLVALLSAGSLAKGTCAPMPPDQFTPLKAQHLTAGVVRQRDAEYAHALSQRAAMACSLSPVCARSREPIMHQQPTLHSARRAFWRAPHCLERMGRWHVRRHLEELIGSLIQVAGTTCTSTGG